MVDLADLKRRMEGAIDAFKHELAGLRTGRASATLMDPIMVDAYGSPTPLNQLATIAVPEPRLISVQVWDRSVVAAVEKAIRESNLGLNPIIEGALMRIPLPELNEERRLELVKVAHQYAEQAKVAVRHVRRAGMDEAKQMEKDGDIGQDESHALSDKIQKQTDDIVAEIDLIVAAKEEEIMQI